MKNLTISIATVNKILTVAKCMPKESCIRFEFGTGIIQDQMVSKVSITDGNSQTETSILTGLPEEYEKDVKELSVENPMERITLLTTELTDVMSRLALQKREFVVSTNNSEMQLQIKGSDGREKASVSVKRIEDERMKALIPNRNNSSKVELFDPTVMMLRVTADKLITAYRTTSMLNGKQSEMTAFYTTRVKDCTKKTQMVENPDGTQRECIVQNATIQMVATDGQGIITSGMLPAVCMKAEKIVGYISKEDGSFERNELTYEAYKKAYEKQTTIEDGTDSYTFGIPSNVVKDIINIAGIAGGVVDIMIGVKYISVSFNELQTIYTAALRQLKSGQFISVYDNFAQSFTQKNASVTVDGEDFINGLKLAAVYASDKYIGALPLHLAISDKGVVITKEDVKNVVEAVEASTNIDLTEYAMCMEPILLAAGSIPAGNIKIMYGVERPVIFLVPGEYTAADGYGILLIAADEEKARMTVEARRKADEERAVKAGKTGKAGNH